MKRSIIAVAVIAFFALLLFWQKARVLSHGTPSAKPPPSSSDSAKVAHPAAPNSQASGERSPLADALNSPKTTASEDVHLLADIVDTFRTNFPRDGNPVGNNAEITATLTGKNKLRLSLIPPDHPAINRAGELCDRWGTPFIFHAQSGTQMEIRSAGPDKKPYTADDVVHAP